MRRGPLRHRAPGGTVVRRAAAAALTAVLAGACSVPGSGDVEVVTRDAVPFGLLDEDQGPPAASPIGADSLPLFLVADDSGTLVPVERRVEEASVEAVLDELAAGPTRAEEALGLRSAIADARFVAGVTVERGTATVDLTDDFAALGGQDQLLAIAQLVLSLTGQPGVGRAAFTLGGDRIEVPRGDGSLTSGSVSRDAYLPLLDAAG